MLGFAPISSSPIGSTQIGVLDTTVPVMVGTLSSSAITATGFTLAWSAATDNIGVTGYEVSIDNGVTYTSVGNVLTVTESSLASNTLYNTKVRAYDAANNKATPLSLAVSTSAAADSTVPTMNGSLTISAITSSGFTVSWIAASDNVAVTGYKVSTNNGTSYTDVGNVLTYAVSSLAASTLYNVKVLAYDAAANLSVPLSTTATTSASSDTTNPTMNGALTITAITTGGFTATWTSGSDNVGVLGYEISVDTGTPSYTQLGSTLTYTATGLFSATLYNVRVRAYDTSSNRSVSITTTVTTATYIDGVLPTMNGSISVSSVTSGSITASWSAASDNIGVVGYEISVDTGTPSWYPLTNVLTYTQLGLTASTLYNIRVRAFDAAGNRAVPLVTTATTSVAGSGFPFITPAHKNITTVVVPPLVTLSTASPYTIAYNVGLSQELVLYNKTGSDVTVNIKGNDHTVPVPQGGDSVFAITGGLNVNVPANNFTVVSLDKCYAYLLGDIAITASVNAAVSICFVS